MKFSVLKQDMAKPLSLIAGIVEKRHTLAILANVLVVAKEDGLVITGTDLEIELSARIPLASMSSEGEVTVPAKKFNDIFKSLPDGAEVNFSQEGDKIILKCGRSRFSLTSLPASDFPSVDESPSTNLITINQNRLHKLINSTSFAMAQQDVRYYLNGMLWELSTDKLRVVATDGHRLALSEQGVELDIETGRQVIVPRKGVTELGRLLSEAGDVSIVLGNNHLRAETETFVFITKLVDGKFPDYERVIPRNLDKNLVADRQSLREAFSRAAILSNEKYRGVRLVVKTGELQIFANNPEHEEAEELVEVEYEGPEVEIGFNVSYLLDVFSTITSDNIRFNFASANQSATIESTADDDQSLYVVMPMRL